MDCLLFSVSRRPSCRALAAVLTGSRFCALQYPMCRVDGPVMCSQASSSATSELSDGAYSECKEDCDEEANVMFEDADMMEWLLVLR